MVHRPEETAGAHPQLPSELGANCPTTAMRSENGSLLDHRNEDVRLLPSNDAHASIPCYVPAQDNPMRSPPAMTRRRPVRGGVTDRTQDDTSRAAAAILERFNHQVA